LMTRTKRPLASNCEMVEIAPGRVSMVCRKTREMASVGPAPSVSMLTATVVPALVNRRPSASLDSRSAPERLSDAVVFRDCEAA